MAKHDKQPAVNFRKPMTRKMTVLQATAKLQLASIDICVCHGLQLTSVKTQL